MRPDETYYSAYSCTYSSCSQRAGTIFAFGRGGGSFFLWILVVVSFIQYTAVTAHTERRSVGYSTGLQYIQLSVWPARNFYLQL